MKINIHNKKTYFLIFVFGVITIFIISNFFFKSYTIKKNYNVVLITIDDLRVDHLHLYGYNRNISPNIDRLGEEGYFFQQTISSLPLTTPSIASLMTSLIPFNHGVYMTTDQLDKSKTTLAEILKENNYSTGAFVGIASLSVENGLNQGFDVYYTNFTDIGRTGAQELTREAVNWLGKNMNKNFFLWIHYSEVRGPYNEPGYHEIYNSTPPANDEERLIDKYDGAIVFVDRYIKTLLDKLNDLDELDNTIIILTADHGEPFFEHYPLHGHGQGLYDVEVKIPLVITYPNIPSKNKTIDYQVENVDIFPTILDILSFPIPKNIDGKSLMPSIINGTCIRPVVYSITAGNFSWNPDEPRNKIHKAMVRTNEWKLILTYNLSFELFNLEKDPGEFKNLVNIEKDTGEKMEEQLLIWIKSQNFSASREITSNDIREKLRRLGYI